MKIIFVLLQPFLVVGLLGLAGLLAILTVCNFGEELAQILSLRMEVQSAREMRLTICNAREGCVEVKT